MKIDLLTIFELRELMLPMFGFGAPSEQAESSLQQILRNNPNLTKLGQYWNRFSSVEPTLKSLNVHENFFDDFLEIHRGRR